MMHGVYPPNHLAQEASPYLLEHAHNPVDWWPWCTEAFDEAARRDVPVFLSIGYASCHWCHVMAQESFEDAPIAEQLNTHFVCIKVDREQRPDVDAFYMQACLALQGQGGWPMTTFVLPDKRPFYAGSYFPAHARAGSMGLDTLLGRIAGLWREDRDHLIAWADQLEQAMALQNQTGSTARQQKNQAAHALAPLVQRLTETLLAAEDKRHGGVGDAPKFPNVPLLCFLLQTDQPKAHAMVERALEAMALGGIRDQVGHGFFRYAVDEAWRLPHFEKMLQDNALLALVYLDVGRRHREPQRYTNVARDALDYLLDTLQIELGGFCSSQDADDAQGEGAYYLWSQEEVRGLLGDADAARCCILMGLEAQHGVRPDTQTHTGTPRCDPRTGCTLDAVAQQGYLPFRAARYAPEDEAFLEACLPVLLQARRHREAPRVIGLCPLLGNGLAIAALATAAGQLDAPAYLAAAKKAARFVTQHMVIKGRLMGSWSNGKAVGKATADGYAAWIMGLLALAQAEPGTDWLAQAIRWQEAQNTLFLREDGGLTLTGEDAQELPAQQHATEDGPTPSGAAMTAENLLILHSVTGDSANKEVCKRLLEESWAMMEAQPMSHAALIAAAMKTFSES